MAQIRRFREDVVLGDFTNKTLDVKAGIFQDVFKIKLGAKQKAFWGYGDKSNGVDTRAQFICELQKADASIIGGKIRLSTQTPNEYPFDNYSDFRTENAKVAAVNPIRTGLRNDLGKVIGAGQDSFLVIEFKPDADATIDLTKSTILATLTKEEL